MAATTRTSTFEGALSPTRRISLSWRTRFSFTWVGSGSSPISSRKMVPPSASSKRPLRAVAAPVKAPRAWPKSSLSTRSGGSAPQFTATKRRSRREEWWWMARAASSLPVPVSPPRSTVMSRPAACSSSR